MGPTFNPDLTPLRLKPWTGDAGSLDTGIDRPKMWFRYGEKEASEPTEEQREMLASHPDLRKMRRAAEAHRQVRRYIQPKIRPGIRLLDLAEQLEAKTRELLGDDLKSGIGFPTGISINHCAAHDSAIPKDDRMILDGDVVKIDYGTHIDGHIIDSAFTVAFDPKFEPLLDASRDGTWAGIKAAGPDVLINEVSADIQEALESYEVELDGKVYPVKAIVNLGGHDINPYQIHGGALILPVPSTQPGLSTMRMKADQMYAIETFATTGAGMIHNDGDLDTSHFMREFDPPRVPLRLRASRELLGHIMKTRNTLPFCSRWLERDFGPRWRAGMSELMRAKIVTSYPPLSDIRGSYTSQLEHTIYLHEYGKEVLSAGDDY